MTEGCAFHYDYPSPHEDLDPGCQFGAETEFFPCGDNHYCRFHLPLAGKEGKPTAKVAWVEEGPERTAFQDAVAAAFATVEEGKAINLSGVVFPADCDFSERIFPASLWYCARFLGLADFQDATFQDEAFFRDAEFANGAVFRNAEFAGRTFFVDTKFASVADFQHTKFAVSVFFRKAKFAARAVFGYAEFGRQAGFQDVVFAGSAIFQDAEFAGPAYFRDAEFAGDANFAHSRRATPGRGSGGQASDSSETEGTNNRETKPRGESFQDFNFTGGKVAGVADFTNRVFKQPADFSGRRFETAPKFGESRLHEDTAWRGTQFQDTDSKHAADAYRILRHAMERTRNRRQEGIFFALEQGALCNGMSPWAVEWWLSWAYGLSAGYGRSLARPLIALAITGFVFNLIYQKMWYVYCIPGSPYEGQEILKLTIEQVVKPFAVWGRPSPTLASVFREVPFVFQICATLQSVLSLSFLALFILALRWHFKRG